VLLVSIDSLRPDHLGCYGYERDTSPVIDALAAEGVRYETVAAPSSWTLPAHATLFTALPPEGHGLRVDATALTDEAVCLAEVLRDAGYATSAFVGGPFLRRMYGLDQGFDHYDESVVRSFRDAQRGSTSPELVANATDWLSDWDRDGRERPFFLFLHLWDVHYDYAPPPPYDRMFDPDYTGDITGNDFETGRTIHRNMDPTDLEHVVALYDGEIRFTDEHLGQLLAQLDELGLRDDLLVVVTADHGEEFFEHGAKGHRKNLFDPTLLVPLVMRWPGRLPAGEVVQNQVRLQDVPTTILALAGVEPPFGFGFQGQGAPRALRPDQGDGAVDSAGDNNGSGHPAYADLEGRVTTLRTDRYKFVRRQSPSGDVRESLFDVTGDGLERRIEIGTETGTGTPSAELTATMNALRDELQAWKTMWGRRRPLNIEIVLSVEQLETLRDIGYIR
jgi:arylsulfatase A-like enzyme